MINIAICDSETNTTDKAKELITAVGNDLKATFRLEIFTDYEDLLYEATSSERFQVILLGTEANGKSGISAAKTLRSRKIKSIILFISATDKYALASYDVSAYFYFLQPPDEARFNFVFHRIFSSLDSSKGKSVTLKRGAKYYTILLSAIRYVASESHNINIYQVGNKVETFGIKLDDFCNLIDNAPMFIRVHKSYLINYKAINTITPSEVTVGNDVLPVSRSLKNEALLAYKTLMGKA